MKPRELSDLILLAAIWGSSLRLITQVGPTQAASIGGAVILTGTALVRGLLPRRRVLGPGGPR